MNFLLLILFCAGTVMTQTTQSNSLSVGSKAPHFSLRYATKDSIAAEPITLSDLIGKKHVVLAFYPADWSGGCTKEVCSFRDNFTEMTRLDAEILAISGDYVYSHHEWAKHHNLPFKLLTDHDHAVSKEYGSYNAESGYNRRTVFIIDRRGTIAYTDYQYSARDSESFNKLKAALDSLR